MGTEIEHKFRVRRERLPARLPPGKHIEQGYLSASPAVRVRICKEHGRSAAFLTIKGKGRRVRAEFEYSIPAADARALMKLCGLAVLTKTRRQLGRWEVDEFLGRHKGLWLAELELRSARERLPQTLPEWLGAEVTADARYANSALARWPARPGRAAKLLKS